jgi:predicted cupin superfamily sugar epimerase
LILQIGDDSGRRSVRLGSDLAAGERPQAIVPPQAWQAAESTGDWTLVGCTVAPGFDFAKFELAPKGWEPE